MSYTISGIQQLGVGVRDVETAWSWYRSAFGMDVSVFQDEAEAPLMTRYTNAAVQSRNAVLALNLAGGAGFEIWQLKTREPVGPAHDPVLGDTGILAGVMKSADVEQAFSHLASLGATLGDEPQRAPDGRRHFFVKDPYGNIFQIAERDDWFGRPAQVGGVAGALIGTTDIDSLIPVAREVLGYDTVLYDETGVFDDFASIPGGDRRLRRVKLGHSAPRKGPFSELMGSSTLELVQAVKGSVRKIFDGRIWGDLGFIHLCYDVRGMDALAAKCAAQGHAFTVDSSTTFDMGSAGGRFSYIEDKDGTLFEFVETHKLPVFKGIGLDLTKRPADKPLPRWMIKMLGLGRVK